MLKKNIKKITSCVCHREALERTLQTMQKRTLHYHVFHKPLKRTSLSAFFTHNAGTYTTYTFSKDRYIALFVLDRLRKRTLHNIRFSAYPLYICSPDNAEILHKPKFSPITPRLLKTLSVLDGRCLKRTLDYVSSPQTELFTTISVCRLKSPFSVKCVVL